MKYTEGFSRLWPSVWTVLGMAASVILLGWSLKILPLGTAYAVWTGIGAVGTAILGIYLFGESREVLRFVCIGLIVEKREAQRVSIKAENREVRMAKICKKKKQKGGISEKEQQVLQESNETAKRSTTCLLYTSPSPRDQA
eukprot:TRINITY_DN2167_c0_g1_i2.p3 TRINITY_DN2167_c0_g1~~TRINITY_DN2167_c0_g1_i2.p3  ORF type:complete len:141 (+),score=20.65 TRINITY_DN2167_c0_g1_i2:168-590(+)